MRSFSGASVRRVIDRSHVEVPEHAHDWPVVSLFVLGSYLNTTEIGERFISAPSAVFYRAGAAHRNRVAAVGFEQIEIEFDPAWLGLGWLASVPVRRWIGGRAGTQARRLANACQGDLTEARLRAALQQLLEEANHEIKRESAGWIGTIRQQLNEDTSLRVRDLAKAVGRHPSWVGSAYRDATGEKLQETAARFRVERASCLLRETDQPYASIASEAGFCDQSHMNRTFRRVLGRSPAAVRMDRLRFRQTTSG